MLLHGASTSNSAEQTNSRNEINEVRSALSPTTVFHRATAEHSKQVLKIRDWAEKQHDDFVDKIFPLFEKSAAEANTLLSSGTIQELNHAHASGKRFSFGEGDGIVTIGPDFMQCMNWSSNCVILNQRGMLCSHALAVEMEQDYPDYESVSEFIRGKYPKFYQPYFLQRMLKSCNEDPVILQSLIPDSADTFLPPRPTKKQSKRFTKAIEFEKHHNATLKHWMGEDEKAEALANLKAGTKKR